MNLLATIAAIIAWFTVSLLLAHLLGKHLRHTRDNAESDDAELCGFFIVPEIDSIHIGGVNSK